jgi:hypothetical protein
MRRLEDIVYSTEGDQESVHETPQKEQATSYEDIIKLQILTIATLEKDKFEKRERGLSVLRAMKYQGEEMISHGEFIIKMVDEEVDRYYRAN